jgi:ribose transport system permease protein
VSAKFYTVGDLKTILESQTATALASVGLMIPMAAGAFDLAIGAEVGLGVVLVSWLLAKAGIPMVPAIAVTLIVGGFVGLVSAILITRIRIDSFIATLAISSVLTAAALWITSDEQIVGLSSTFDKISTQQVFGITVPVYILLGVSLCVWYVMEVTPLGRRVYATGGNIEAARLAGVATAKVITFSLIACGVLAALAGVVESASLGGGDPTIGPSYLLPAFTATFLGSTQFRRGRFNIWGTIVAVYVLQAGIQGLELAGAPVWIPDLFDGVALAAAVGLARFELRSESGAAIRRLLRFGSTRKTGRNSHDVEGPAGGEVA